MFSKIDLVSAFVTEDVSNTAVITSFDFLCMLFGVLNASQTFQSVVFDPFKCVFGVSSLESLGLLVDFNSIYHLLPKRQLQRFLGMVNFYRRFISNYVGTVLPLTSPLSDPEGSFVLSADPLAVSDKVRAVLADTTLLAHFALDALISLMIGAPDVTVGAVL
nr:unnamed protein product [Spirometra erinaceieuropaei]